MASIDQLKASDGNGNASVAVVQSSRAPASTTIVVDTVLNINTNFIGTMGTPHTFTDPITSETITVISEATAVDFKGHVDGSNLEIDTIAPGYTDAGSEIGDIVIIRPTTQWGDKLAEVLEVSLEDDGTLKANTVNTTELVDGSATPAKLLAGTGTNWVWDSYTPTISASGGGGPTLGNGTFDCAYQQTGKTVDVRFKLTVGSTTSFGTGNVIFTLPVTALAALPTSASGAVYILDTSTSEEFGATFRIINTTTFLIQCILAASPARVVPISGSAGVPFSFATGDVISGMFSYEAA